MKKLSVEQQLLRAKYQYPATCTTYKNGVVTSKRVVTHNIKATEELQEMYPSLKLQVERFRLDRKTPYKKFSLGKLGL